MAKGKVTDYFPQFVLIAVRNYRGRWQHFIDEHAVAELLDPKDTILTIFFFCYSLNNVCTMFLTKELHHRRAFRWEWSGCGRISDSSFHSQTPRT